VERLERGFRDLLADWDQTYEKFAKLNARMAKRAKRELMQAELEEAAPIEPNGTDPVSAQILQWRGDALRRG
jgi:GrpB-like predicted nucleotidyltransferase (UPF0157 family)